MTVNDYAYINHLIFKKNVSGAIFYVDISNKKIFYITYVLTCIAITILSGKTIVQLSDS